MTTGIYKLSFMGTNKCYIGQSINIERRYVAHLRDLKSGNSTKKLQSAYTEFGLPSIEILLECVEAELDVIEEEAIEIYDSVNNGYNLYASVYNYTAQYGEITSNAKYSNETYISIFKYLVEGIYSRKEIAELLDVSTNVVTSIHKLENHIWLKELFPKEYGLLEKRKQEYSHSSNNTIETKLGKALQIKSPEGTMHEVTSIRGFAREHSLCAQALGALLSGKGKSLKGWTLPNTVLKEYPLVIAPDGTTHSIPYNGARAFAVKYNLNPGALSELLSKKRTTLKGWTIKMYNE